MTVKIVTNHSVISHYC